MYNVSAIGQQLNMGYVHAVVHEAEATRQELTDYIQMSQELLVQVMTVEHLRVGALEENLATKDQVLAKHIQMADMQQKFFVPLFLFFVV
jgi:hypothetical protein